MKGNEFENVVLKNTLTKLYYTEFNGSLSKKILLVVLSYEEANWDFVKEKTDLQNKYAERNEDGTVKTEAGKVLFSEENRAAFDAEFSALLNKSYKVVTIEPSELEQIPHVTAAELKSLVDANIVKLQCRTFEQLDVNLSG